MLGVETDAEGARDQLGTRLAVPDWVRQPWALPPSRRSPSDYSNRSAFSQGMGPAWGVAASRSGASQSRFSIGGPAAQELRHGPLRPGTMRRRFALRTGQVPTLTRGGGHGV